MIDVETFLKPHSILYDFVDIDSWYAYSVKLPNLTRVAFSRDTWKLFSGYERAVVWWTGPNRGVIVHPQGNESGVDQCENTIMRAR